MVFINPKIIRSGRLSERLPSGGKTEKGTNKKKNPQKLEGCLSLKDIWGTVLRSPRVKVSYTDQAGKTETKEFKGFLGTIVQHEYDHLNGILFPRRVLEQKGKLYKSEKDEKGEDVFEELKLP